MNYLKKRKKRFVIYVLTNIILGSFLLSCSDSQPPTLEVNPMVINFPKENGVSRELTIKTTDDASWVIYDNECKDWLSISTTEAKGSMTVTLTTKNENQEGDLSMELGIVATNDGGSTSTKVRITREGLPDYDKIKAEVSEILCMSYGMACAMTWGDATSYFLYKIYKASEFNIPRRNYVHIAEEATKPGSTWKTEVIPSDRGIEIIDDQCDPGTDYVLVTVAYGSNGNRGQINFRDFRTKDVNELDQPWASVSPQPKFVEEDHGDGINKWYKWDVTRSGHFYITYACASSKLEETMQRDKFGEFDLKNGIKVAWNIFMEAKKDNLINSRAVNFNGDNPDKFEMLYRSSSEVQPQWIRYRNEDKYLQIATWVFKAEDFNTYSGIVYDVTYKVNNGELDPKPKTNLYEVVSPKTELSPDKDTTYVLVSSRENWKVELDNNQTWCHVSPKSGSNNGILTIIADQNKTSNSRSAIVTVKGSNSGDKEIKISQAAYTLSAKPTSLQMKSEGEEKRVDITSNDSWTVKSNREWCKVSSGSGGGSGNGSIWIYTDKNPESTTRTATVTVIGENSGKTVSIRVTQEAESSIEGEGVYAKDILIEKGTTTAKLKVCLKNSMEVCAISFHLALPKGVTMARRYVVLDEDRIFNHNYFINDTSNGDVQIAVYDTNPFFGNDGPVVYVPLTISEDLAAGTYEIKLYEISASTPAGESLTVAGVMPKVFTTNLKIVQ